VFYWAISQNSRLIFNFPLFFTLHLFIEFSPREEKKPKMGELEFESGGNLSTKVGEVALDFNFKFGRIEATG